MQVLESSPGVALCELDGERRQINTLLVGDQTPGTWLLVFLDQAREVLAAEEATRIHDALKALDAILHGETNVDHLFADLVDLESKRPDRTQHVRPRDGE